MGWGGGHYVLDIMDIMYWNQDVTHSNAQSCWDIFIQLQHMQTCMLANLNIQPLTAVPGNPRLCFKSELLYTFCLFCAVMPSLSIFPSCCPLAEPWGFIKILLNTPQCATHFQSLHRTRPCTQLPFVTYTFKWKFIATVASPPLCISQSHVYIISVCFGCLSDFEQWKG